MNNFQSGMIKSLFIDNINRIHVHIASQYFSISALSLFLAMHFKSFHIKNEGNINQRNYLYLSEILDRILEMLFHILDLANVKVVNLSAYQRSNFSTDIDCEIPIASHC